MWWHTHGAVKVEVEEIIKKGNEMKLKGNKKN